jgi:hypothetical protein
MFGRKKSPEHQTWLAMHAVIERTLLERLASGPDALMSELDAGFLADHVADDLMQLEPSVPPEHWIADR